VSYLAAQLDAVRCSMPLGVIGQVQGISGLAIEASGLPLAIGSMCRIRSYGGKTSLAEVIGLAGDRTLLMSMSDLSGVCRGDAIENIASAPRIWCSEQLLGRVLDAFGSPIDGQGPLRLCGSRRIDGRGVEPLARVPIDTPISTGIRAIDGLHTCGMGQRMGIFSGPGVGKSMLLAAIARHAVTDVSVVVLVGERGREVQEFLRHGLGEDGLARSVVIVAGAEEQPPLLVRAARVGATIAEYFRDTGKNVLFLLDSITRLCHAQRQIGLAAREPPATKGFPPSVFAMLPEILERAGRNARGSITGFYTVLVEGDDFNEPIPDAVKGIIDGHLWLSRSLANRGHYPALDILQSISRVRSDVCPPGQLGAARRLTALTAVYQDIEDLVNINAYVPGQNLENDLAIRCHGRITAFLRQDIADSRTMEQSRKELFDLVAWIDEQERQIGRKVKG